MEPRSLRLGFLVLVALTAGCTGLFGSSGEETLTPVPELEQPAPGVPAADNASTQIRVDADRLLAANDRALAETNYTLARTVTIRGPNGTMRIERTIRYGSGGARFEEVRIDGDGDLSSVVDRGVLWSNGTKIWTKTRLSNGRAIVSQRIVDEIHPYGYGPDLDNRVLTATTFTVDERTGDGGAILRSDGTFSMGPGLVALLTGPAWNATARLVVEDNGLVSELDVTYETATSASQLEVSISHRIVSRGTTSVSRPGWVPTNTTRSDAQ